MATTYDDIIVGAGSSGAVLAARLSEDLARRVLLLEAGPDYPSIESTPNDLRDSTWIYVVQHDWGFKADAMKSREIEYPRGKVVGGCSAVNAPSRSAACRPTTTGGRASAIRSGPGRGSCPTSARALRRGRVEHAERAAREHQPQLHHDRRAHGRLDARGVGTPSTGRRPPRLRRRQCLRPAGGWSPVDGQRCRPRTPPPDSLASR